MSYEQKSLHSKLQDHLNALADAAAYKRLATVHKEAISNIETADPYAFNGVEGYGIGDYQTWK